jgi:hypothetical protein
LVCT